NVSARLAASALLTASTPYFSVRYADRSSCRSVNSSSAGVRPARSRPDRSASPIFPAPSTATVSLMPCIVPDRAPSPRLRFGRSTPRGQRPQEEPDVRRALREAAHEVAVPLVAVRDVDAHGRARDCEPLLLEGTDPVQHLELVTVRRPPRSTDPL